MRDNPAEANAKAGDASGCCYCVTAGKKPAWLEFQGETADQEGWVQVTWNLPHFSEEYGLNEILGKAKR